MRTQGAKVHNAGDGDGPEVHGVDEVTTIELSEELALDTWMSGHSVKERTNQKTIGQPTVQEEDKVGNDAERIRENH